MFSFNFVIILYTIFTFIINVYGEVSEKPQIYALNKDNQKIIINDLLEINNFDMKTIQYFIVGDDEQYKENPLILSTPQDTNSIIEVMLRAMQDYIYIQHNEKKNDFYGKIEFSTWGTEKICDAKDNDTNLCPSVVLQGTTNFPYRYSSNEIIPLDDYFEKHMMNNQTIFSTKFIKQAEYDYSIDGKYVAVPLITDIRIMYFNRTTYDNVKLDYPPPLGSKRQMWTWNDLVQDVQKIDEYFKENNIQANPFDFYGLYDEEMKFLSVILRNYGVPTISSSQRCGFCEHTSDTDMKESTVKAFQEVVQPLFNIIKEHNHNWCNYQDPAVEAWLNENGNGAAEDDYIDQEAQKSKFIIDCAMNAPNNRTDGLIFSSPPSMSGNNLITNKAMLSATSYELGVAYVPGNFSFLGGSGLMISSAVTKERQDTAWEYIVHLTESNNYLIEIGNGASMISPYESLVEDDLLKTQWSAYIQQLRNSLPISYPRRTSTDFHKLEMNHPVRLMFYDVFERGTEVEKAVSRTCNAINYFLEPTCTMNNYNFTFNEQCSKGRLIIDQNKIANATCHGGIDIKPDTELFVDCYYENYDSFYGIVVLVLVVLGITISVIYISLFTAYRKADPIRKASYWFSIIIVIGSILMYLSVLLDLGFPNRTLCICRIWFMTLGFGCSLGGLVVKAYRIYSIFNNRDLKPLVITDKQLFKYFTIIMVTEVLCLSVWTNLYFKNVKMKSQDIKRIPKYIDGSNIDHMGEYTFEIKFCPSYNSLCTLILIYGLNCILILAGCFLSIKTWSIPQMYSETKFMGSTIFMIGFVVLVCIPSLNSLPEYDIKNRFILSSFAICFTCFLASGVFCIPKIYNSYQFYKQDFYKRAMEQNSNSLDYSTNNGQIKFMLDNSNNLVYGMSKNSKGNNPYNKNSNVLSNETINRAAAMGNTLIDGNMLGINSKLNPGFSMLNSELNSSSIYHKRVSRCRIINNELQCPDCGCVFEITE